MDKVNIGDIVSRKSYEDDLFFKVVDIEETGSIRIAVLKGIHYRIKADSPIDDLTLHRETVSYSC